MYLNAPANLIDTNTLFFFLFHDSFTLFH